MSKTSLSLGKHYENLACQWLVRQGLTIVATNFNVPAVGEIDIVAIEECQAGQRAGVRPTLVFVEVRARQRSQYAKSVESVDRRKQRRIIQAAYAFIEAHPAFGDYDYRFDVIGFDFVRSRGRHDTVKHGATYDDATLGQQDEVGCQWIRGAFLVEG